MRRERAFDATSRLGTVFRASIAHHVYDLGSILEMIHFVESKKTHAGVIGFAAQHAVELDGVPDGLVDLQCELRAF